MNAKRIILAFIAILVLLSACSTEAGASDQQTFTGTIMTGAQIGKAKNYCEEGLYLVAEDGYLVNEIQMLLLRIPDAENETEMLSDEQYIGKKVEVTGKYPPQKGLCKALLCTCEDYILVDQIQISQ
jgi:hypothetical protein